MAISKIGDTTAAVASGTTISLGNPGDEGGAFTLAGDLLVAMVLCDDLGQDWFPPSSWVQFLQAAVVADFTIAIFTKVATVAEEGNQFFDFNWAGASRALVGILALVREADLAIEGEQSTVFTSGLSYVAPSYTTIKDNSLIFRLLAAEFIGAGPATFDIPAGTTAQAIATNGTSNPQLKYYTDTAIKTPPGATGTKTFVATVGEASVRVRAMTFGIPTFVASSGGGGGMGSPGAGRKPVTKADVLAAREQAIATGAKVKTKFDPRRVR